MTTVHCFLSECRSWINGMCKRRTVKVVGMKCLDFNRRRTQFRYTSTVVQCTNEGCNRFYRGTCTASEITMKGDGCEPLSMEGGKHGDGRTDEGSGQIPIRR